jgi:4-hydroxy-3-methylbut-2-enyl diphosphate reductase
VLYQICKEANPRTHFVEVESELLPEWFDGVETVGISGATSTPQWLMERIKWHIESMPVPQPLTA